ncbi:MAG: hypothetical protein ACWGPS_00665 [Candidatus Promineifilaceae bacterium]
MHPESSYRNPYTVGEPVTDPSRFFGRQHAFAWLRVNLEPHAERRLLLLHGPEGIGKSSFLRRLGPGTLAEGQSAVYLDLQAMPDRSLRTFLWSLTKAIMSAPLASGSGMPRIEKQMFVLHSEMVFMEGVWLPLVSALGDDRLVVALDSADCLLSPAPGSAEEAILAFLYDLPGGDRTVYFLLALGSRVEILDASTLKPFKSARSLRLKGLTRAETLALMRQPVPYRVPTMIADYVHALTTGHPGDIQTICSALFRRAQSRPINHLTLADVLAVLATDLEAHQLHTAVYRRRPGHSIRLGDTEDADAV